MFLCGLYTTSFSKNVVYFDYIPLFSNPLNSLLSLPTICLFVP